MPNTNPQAIKLANERFRRLDDKLAQTYHFCRLLQAQIKAEGIDTLFTNDKDPLVDGSAEDGRSPLTNEDIKRMIAIVDEVVAFFDSDPARRDLLLRGAVNPQQF